MLKVERFVTASPEQMRMVIDGMRNPHNSWDKSDSYKSHIENPITLNTADFAFCLGENDEKLMRNLAAGGSVHAKYRRMMPVWVDILAPLYWWKEFETYKVGTVANSCSTMHKIHASEMFEEDFSIEDIEMYSNDFPDDDAIHSAYCAAVNTIVALNRLRYRYNETKDKKYWRAIIQLLPSSYNQKRTIFTNYEALSAMYHWRHDHKLDEWRTLCAWMKELPYGYLITGGK